MNNSTPYNFTRLWPVYYHDTNCSNVMQVWNFLQWNSTGDSNFLFNYGSERDIYHYIIHGLNGSLRQASLGTPPMNQNFFNWAVADRLLLNVVDDLGWKECSNEMCKAIGWQGSPDIAGVGMLATYIIQAILITVYLCGILIVNLNQRSSRSRMWPSLRRILCALLDSTREFLSASAIFSLALLVASLCSISPDLNEFSTTWILGLVIPLYSVLAVVILHLAAWDFLLRYKGRVLALLIIDVLVIVLAARSSTFFNGTDALLGLKEYAPEEYESPCLRGVSVKSMAIFSWTIAGILCFGVTVYLVDFLVSGVRHRPGLCVRLSGMIRWGIVGVGLCTMWYLIGWFVKLTLEIRSRAGNNNKDNEWTFGQVLALSTWAPFIIEFTYNIWEGPRKANEALSNYPSKWALPGLFAMRQPEDEDERGNFMRLE